MRIAVSIGLCLLLGGCANTPPQPVTPPASVTPTAPVTPPARAQPSPTPASTGQASPSPSAGAPVHLAEALRAAPPEVERIDFTDWSAMRSADGMPARGDQLTEEQRTELLGGIYMRHAVPSGFGYHKIHSHREAWGWDSLDVEWEATLNVDTRMVHVVRLPDHLSMSELADRYAAFGFSRSQRGEALIFSADLDPRNEWLPSSDLALVNSALFKERHLLLASHDAQLLERVVDTVMGELPAAADSRAVVGAAAAVGRLVAGVVLLGEEVCSRLGPPWLWPDDGEWLLPALPELHPYEALIVGHRYDGESLIGVIAMAYESAQDAQIDRATRLLMADGPSLSDFMGWGLEETGMEIYFEPIDARVEDTALVLEVVPARNRPQMLFGMIGSGEMLFAICGEDRNPPQEGFHR